MYYVGSTEILTFPSVRRKRQKGVSHSPKVDGRTVKSMHKIIKMHNKFADGNKAKWISTLLRPTWYPQQNL